LKETDLDKEDMHGLTIVSMKESEKKDKMNGKVFTEVVMEMQ